MPGFVRNQAVFLDQLCPEGRAGIRGQHRGAHTVQTGLPGKIPGVPHHLRRIKVKTKDKQADHTDAVGVDTVDSFLILLGQTLAFAA